LSGAPNREPVEIPHCACDYATLSQLEGQL
jgi:hypothetical protein